MTTTGTTFNTGSTFVDPTVTEANDPVLFDDQCYLMSYWKDFVDYHKMSSICSMSTAAGVDENQQPTPPRNILRPHRISLLDSGVPEVIPNLFRSSNNAFKYFRKLTPELQAILVPKIRIYKITGEFDKHSADQKTEKISEIEFEFPTIEAPGTIDTSNAVKTDFNSVGIKSFNYSLEGGLPGTVELFIKSKLSLFFGSINDFFRTRSAPMGFKNGKSVSLPYSYADLLKQHDSGLNKDKNLGEMSTFNVIKIDVGWATPDIKSIARLLNCDTSQAIEIAEGIQESSISLMLNHAAHDFKIQKDGSIELTIDYIGHMESAWMGKKFDIFAPKTDPSKLKSDMEKLKDNGKKKLFILKIITDQLERRSMLENGVKCARSIAVGLPADKRRKECDSYRSADFKMPLPEWKTLFANSPPDVMRIVQEGNNIGIHSWISGESILSKEEAQNATFRAQGEAAVEQGGVANAVLSEDFVRNSAIGHGLVFAGNDPAFFAAGVSGREKKIIEKSKASRNNTDKLKKAVEWFMSDPETQAAIKNDDTFLRYSTRSQIQIESYRKIVKRLNESGRIQFIDLRQSDVKDWRARTINLNEWWSDLVKKTKEDQEEEKTEKTTGVKTPTTTTTPAPPSASEITIDVSGGSPESVSCKDVMGCKTSMQNYDHLGKWHNIYNIKKCLESDEQEEFDVVGKQKSISTRRLHFMYFSDIIDAAVESIIEDNPGARRFVTRTRIVLGNLLIRDFVDKTNTELYSVNIGDIPVSLHDYVTWFTKKVSSKQAKVWTLRDFLKDAVSDLIFAAMGEGCPSKIKQPCRPSVVQLSSIGYRLSGKQGYTGCRGALRDPLTRLPRVCMEKNKLSQMKRTRKRQVWPQQHTTAKLATKKGLPGIAARPETPRIHGGKSHRGANIFNYLYVYGLPEDKLGSWASGSRVYDEENGIFHFDLSSASGLVRDVSFTKTDIGGLREKRILEASELTGIGNQLLDQYDAKITLYGTNFFFPGMYVYISPSLPNSFGEKTAITSRQVLGLGGYYIITNIDHNLSEQTNETVLTAVWQGYTGNDYSKKNKNSSGSSKGGETRRFHSCENNYDVLWNWHVNGPCTKEQGAASDVPISNKQKK